MTEVHYCRRCLHRIEALARFCGECGGPLDQRGSIKISFGRTVWSNRTVPTRIIGMIDGYVLLRELGSGGMGAVYEAMDIRSAQPFAIKVLNNHFRMRRGADDLLMKEAATQSRIVDRSVVRMFKFLDTAGSLALVMELIRGQSVESLIADQSPDADDPQLGFWIWIAAEMATGLSAVHAHDFLHADVKPANFLFGRDERGQSVLKITDFGISRSIRRELATTRTRTVAGTPGFMAPEQILGERLTPASDIYSLGCVYFVMFAREHVFPFTSLEANLRSHLYEPARRLGDLAPTVPPTLSRLVDAMLAKDPAMRPPSAANVRSQLDLILKGVPA
jgi:serine/threonine protein kinase